LNGPSKKKVKSNSLSEQYWGEKRKVRKRKEGGSTNGGGEEKDTSREGTDVAGRGIERGRPSMLRREKKQTREKKE